MHFKMYFSERKNSMRCFYQKGGCILDAAPSINTFTLFELKHAGFLLVLKEATVSSVSYHWHKLYFLLGVPTAMIFLRLSCSSSPNSALMSTLERDLLRPASFFLFSLTLYHLIPFLHMSSPLRRSFLYLHSCALNCPLESYLLECRTPLVLFRAKTVYWLWKHLINIC